MAGGYTCYHYTATQLIFGSW